MALVTRAKILGDVGDIAALRDLEKREKHNEAVRRGSDGMSEEIRKARSALDLLLRKARSTLRALNIELQEEAVERGSPITLAEVTLPLQKISPAAK